MLHLNLRPILSLSMLLCSLVYSCKEKNVKPEIVFEKSFGGDLDEYAKSIIMHNNYLYVFGTTKSFGDDNGDHYLIKLDLDGSLIFEKTYGGIAAEAGVDITTSPDDNLLLLGYTQSSGAGGSDVHLMKIDNNGNMIWEKTYGGNYNDAPASFISSNAGICIAGTTDNSGMRDIYVIWTDQDGNLVREKHFGGPEVDGGSEVIMDGQEYLIFGYTYSFGALDRDLYIMRLDSIGDSLTSARFGGNGYEESQNFALADSKDIILCGHSTSTDPNHDAYVVKITSSFELIWESHLGGLLHEGGEGIIINDDGDYIIAGCTESFGPQGENAYLISIDINGMVLSEKYYGGAGIDRFDDVIEDQNYYYLTGSTNSFGNGSSDFYILKLNKSEIR